MRAVGRAVGKALGARMTLQTYVWRQLASTTLDESVIITKACAQRILQLREAAGDARLKLRVAVEGGGCSGFQYTFRVDADPVGEDDRVFGRDGAQVVLDQQSLELMRGATLDFVQEMIRSSFAVLNNPNSESACGCGTSFAVKAFAQNPAID